MRLKNKGVFMKKIFLIVLVFVFMGLLVACKRSYKEEAGIYELYEMSGDLSLEDFSYYYIQLNEQGEVLVKSLGAHGDQEEYTAFGTFKISGSSIHIYTKVGFTRIKESYDYINGEIHMIDVYLEGYDITFTAKFRRTI